MMDASLIRSMRQNHLLLPLSNLHSPLILNIPIEPSVSSEHKINTKRPPHPRSQTDIEKGFILNHDLFHIADLPKKNLPPADTAIKNENYKAWQHLLDNTPMTHHIPDFTTILMTALPESKDDFSIVSDQSLKKAERE